MLTKERKECLHPYKSLFNVTPLLRSGISKAVRKSFLISSSYSTFMERAYFLEVEKVKVGIRPMKE